jgi:hypothetical protein
MKVYVLICDATDYNGNRDVFGVYPTYDAAKAIGDWEREKQQDWVNSMRETGENVGDWVSSFHVEEVEFYQ